MFPLFPLLFVTLIYISEQIYDKEACCSLFPGVKCTPFKAAFAKELAKSRDLLNQFDVTLKPKEATIEFYNDALWFYKKLGASDPASIAEKIVRAAQYKFNGTTPPNTFAALCVTIIERFLKKEKIITNENAASIAQTYAKLLNEARCEPGKDGSSASNLFSICIGTTNLLLAVTEMTPKKADLFGRFAIQGYSSLPVQCG